MTCGHRHQHCHHLRPQSLHLGRASTVFSNTHNPRGLGIHTFLWVGLIRWFSSQQLAGSRGTFELGTLEKEILPHRKGKGHQNLGMRPRLGSEGSKSPIAYFYPGQTMGCALLLQAAGSTSGQVWGDMGGLSTWVQPSLRFQPPEVLTASELHCPCL